MQIAEAIRILELQNAWRVWRGEMNDPTEPPCQNFHEVTEAINTVVAYFKESDHE